MIIDKIANWQLYPFGPAWTKAFDFLQGLDAASEEKCYRLQDEDMFAQVSLYDTCSPETTCYETHRKYVDIQAVLAGAERMEWAARDSLHVKTPYDGSKDAGFYNLVFPGPAHITALPGIFVVFFPDDGHMPQLQIDNTPRQVKKVVVKIKKELLGL